MMIQKIEGVCVGSEFEHDMQIVSTVTVNSSENTSQIQFFHIQK